MTYDYDVIIIGSGPAGFSCAMQSTKFNKKVLIVEASDESIGGSWISKGTIPSKALRAAAKSIQSFQSQFGDPKGRKPYDRFRMEDIMAYKMPILENKNRKIKNDIIKNEIDTARGWGKIIDEHTVEVTDQMGEKKTWSTRFIFLSTGSSPVTPDKLSIDHTKVLDYTTILDLTHIPHRLAIIGNGIIAIEYATIFSALGTRVTILSEDSETLPFLDQEIRDALFNTFKKNGIQHLHNVVVKKISYNDLRNCDEVTFREGEDGRLQVIETEQILYAAGKKPNTEGIGLENLAIKTDDQGRLIVNNVFQTDVASVYAGGDLIGPTNLASASFVQGRLAAVHMFGNKAAAAAPDSPMPFAIYSIPEIASIGLTEEQAGERGIDATVGRAYYENMTRADLDHETDGLLKLVFRTDNLQLLGIHIYGENAGDLIHLGQSVMHLNGTIEYFIDQVLNYPTYSEAYKVAAFNGLNRVNRTGIKYRNQPD